MMRSHFTQRTFILFVISALLSLCATSVAVGGATTKPGESPSIDEVLLRFDDWWLRAAPFPDGPSRKVLSNALETGSKDPRVSFWLSRAIVRDSIFVPLSSSQKDEVKRLTKQAADGGLDAAIAMDAIDHIISERNMTAAQRDAYRQKLEGLMERRNPDALLGVGIMYREGWAVDKNLQKSIKLLRLATEAGYVRAYRELATSYRELGDYANALESLNRGVELNDVQAKFQLGTWYRKGEISPADEKGAEKLLRVVVTETGMPDAQLELAFLLGENSRSAKDHSEARKLIEAAAQYNDEAKYLLALMELYGKIDTEIDLISARQILEALASRGHAGANYDLGMALVTGSWLPKDVESGMTHLKVSANAGDERAQNELKLFQYLQSEKAAAK